MKKLVSILLVTLMCCGLLVGCGSDGVKLPHNKKITLESTKKEIEKVEMLTKNDMGNFETGAFFSVNGQELMTTYIFDEGGNIDYIMYKWEKNKSLDTSEETGRLLLNHAREYFRELGWKDNFNDVWELKDETDFTIHFVYPHNATGDKDRLLIFYERSGAEENQEIEEAITYFEDKQPIDDSNVVKSSQITSAINTRLDEMIKEDKYAELIESWSGIVHSLDNSCEIEVEFQAAAEVSVGTVSALRNELCDVVIGEYPDVSEISVRFIGIGTYTYTVGEGWDREVSDSDSK